MSICDENFASVEGAAIKIHLDILGGNFDVSLQKYGLAKQPHLKVVTAATKPISLLELYDLYCESRKGSVEETTLGQFRSLVKYVCWKRGKFFHEVAARGTSQECPECGAEVKKDLSVRVHSCPSCGYTTDKDVASGQVIRNRGIRLISTDGQSGKETACADDLPGVGVTQSRQVSKSRKGKTRKTSK